MNDNPTQAMLDDHSHKPESEEDGKNDRRGGNGNHDTEKSFYKLNPGDLIVVTVTANEPGGYSVQISNHIAGFLQTERTLTVGMGLVARFISMRENKPLLTLDAAKE